MRFTIWFENFDTAIILDSLLGGGKRPFDAILSDVAVKRHFGSNCDYLHDLKKKHKK